MSMMGEFRELTPEALGQLKNDPALVGGVVSADFRTATAAASSGMDAILAAAPPKQRDMLKQMLAAMSPEQRVKMEKEAGKAAVAMQSALASTPPATSAPPAGLGVHISLEKAWHGVHFLLCGTAGDAPAPFGQAVLGGTPLGQDLGYGPARFLEAGDVAAVATALSSIDRVSLATSYDGAALQAADVYPGGWDDPENREWLLRAFDELRDFYAAVASRGNAVLIYLV